ncbi:MAG: alanine--tRNA ligase [Candidatus Omnitrophica bacterium]|nr:alanine--tRNA ligase [Candidatus Omnitrophota bacterium]
MKADILREKFLDFFKNRKHKVVEPDSLVPKDDPTVLFTPAGMNQFKKEFLGSTSGFLRAATCQRCLRTDDLDKVGKTSGHHTFFEMLGNFSFGDYFKKEAITWAWEFLTKELKISQDKLWVSVYKDDQEAYKIWRDLIKVHAQRIVKLGDKENFWPSEAKEKGPNGPCGPCSEIFFDWGVDVGCKSPGCDPSCSCGRFVEIWNLVFTQFNRKETGKLEPLPNKNIDTGMGLERLAAVMQGARNNFETELFQPVIKEISREALPENKKGLAYAISDHLRAVVFSIYDGVLPSNESRGYVVRKLIRKSVLHLRALGQKEPFLYKLVPVSIKTMQEFYPHLAERKENISQIILAEEKSFISTLNSSAILFEEKFSALAQKQDPDMAGKITFELYDTYGIPAELTREWLKERKIKISEEAFSRELSLQKNRSKSQSAMKGDVFSSGSADYGVKETKFSGYDGCQVKAKIIKIIKDGAEVKKAGKSDKVSIILDKTAFYAESGGQVGDSGELVRGKSIFAVTDTRKSGKAIIHIGFVKEGNFKNGDQLLARVDSARRLSIARNHTATHLLQAALRKVLGAHVRQQGSLVAEDRLRFDFTHFKDIDREQLDRIEEVVNSYVMADLKLGTKQATLAQAKKTGALAFFGEKYGTKVRVVSVQDVSKELCGGTHLDSTGQIGLFKITQEGSVASGVRRIEAVTGTFAYRVIKDHDQILSEVQEFLNVPAQMIPQEIEKRSRQLKELEKRLSSQRMDSIKSSLDGLLQQAEVISGVKVITSLIECADMDILRKNVDLIKEKADNAVIALGSKKDGKAFLVMGLTPDLLQRGLDAGKLIRQVAGIVGGSGGGRSDFAQAGGDKPQELGKAFEELKNILRGSL